MISNAANAAPYTFFNNAANWSSNPGPPPPGKIGPGTTVHLVGTITSQLIAQGSGAAGSVITPAVTVAVEDVREQATRPVQSRILIEAELSLERHADGHVRPIGRRTSAAVEEVQPDAGDGADG